MGQNAKDVSSLVVGLDFGTDSVRALVVDAATGEELAGEVAYYPRWAAGMYCDPAENRFRQHPLDYIEGMEAAVRGALAKLPPGTAQRVKGIGVGTTGSTPAPVDAHGRPLALGPEFSENPNAMFILWKDHTAVEEAGELNHAARHWGGTDFTKYVGGVYSSEWFWAKILHVLRHDGAVGAAAFSWVEQCDWIPALLTGTESPLRIKRSRCAAGHKAMWHEDWGGLPPEEFLVHIDPLLRGIRGRLYTDTYTAAEPAGRLTPAWAERLGLPPGIPVAVGAIDAHVGAVGGGITPGVLVKIMGTSTCDIMVVPRENLGGKLIGGICGQVDGSVIPGLIGLEAGQSAYGDVYAWYRDLLSWPLRVLLPESSLVDRETGEELHRQLVDELLRRLSLEAAGIPAGSTGLLALDWLNGRRTPYADQTLKGAIVGLSLGSTAPKIFRALVEATAFGSRAINDHLMKEGLEIKEVIALGGIARKNDFVMQVLADVLDMPIKVAVADQACALGAAMFGAVAAGLYPTVEEAQAKMGRGFSKTYTPDPGNAAAYRRLYQGYLNLGRMLEAARSVQGEGVLL
ncbi:MAG TPA: ribulokinase [Peptococcaceae bacterium]|nr:MAG: Ribulokinase [Moorella sp. 60_41]HBT46836.1 ribulokinase [Peptococcaceae bacterium]